MEAIVRDAIEDLCDAFERGGYNPTPLIDLGVLVAGADGSVDDQERALLIDIFQALLETKLSPEVVDVMISASLEVMKKAGAEPRARLVAAILNDCDAAEPGLRVALAIALASEGLSDSERQVIDRIADACDVPKARVDALAEEVRQQIDGEGVESARMSLLPNMMRGS